MGPVSEATDDAPEPSSPDDRLREALNGEFWARADYVDFYARLELRPVEATILERYRKDFGGRVLELGCGAGRLTGALYELAAQLHGIDIAPAMVEHCRQRYPKASFSVADVREPMALADNSCEAIVAGFNVLDVLGAEARGRALEDIRRLLAPGGLLVMSSHNHHYTPSRRSRLTSLYLGDPHHPLASLGGLPRRMRNHRRLSMLERSGTDWSIVNDEAHDFAVLHYYISRDAQEAQLREHGLELIECLDLVGVPVPPGATSTDCPELHYLARLC